MAGAAAAVAAPTPDRQHRKPSSLSMLFTFWQCLLILVLQVCASSESNPFSFSLSPVAQCAPVSFSFSGYLNANDIPTTISLIPPNAQVLRIDIPPQLNVSNGLDVSFFPLPQNTTFLVSLDRNATSLTPVSDFLTVGPSNDASCLGNTTLTSPDIFRFSQNISSSQSFSICYNSSLIHAAPTVRLYQPGQLSTPLAANGSVAGNTTYILPAVSGKFILSVDAGNALRQTSAVQSGASITYFTKSLRIRMVIGASIGAAIIILIGILMIIFVIRERRRTNMPASAFMTDEKKDKPLPDLPVDAVPMRTPSIPNPPYVTAPTQDATPFSSWKQSNLGADHALLQPGSLDIERMLDRASTNFNTAPGPYQNYDDSELNPQSSFLSLTEPGSGEGTVSPTAVRWHRPPFTLPPLRRHSPLDVPKDLTPVRQSFNSSSVARSSLASRVLNLTFLPFEGPDDRPPVSPRSEGRPRK